MADEIERKFMVRHLPTASELGMGIEIRQGYLAQEGDVEVRVRMTPTGSSVTIKGGRGLRRAEVDLPLEPDQAESLWPHTDGRRLEKTRHRVAVGAHTAEVDVYSGSLFGLIVVEVEFSSSDEAAGFAAPDWFGRELTGESGWSNASLARRGRPASHDA